MKRNGGPSDYRSLLTYQSGEANRPQQNKAPQWLIRASEHKPLDWDINEWGVFIPGFKVEVYVNFTETRD